MHALRLMWAAHNEEMWLRRRRSNAMRRLVMSQIDEMPEELFRENYRFSKLLFRNLCYNYNHLLRYEVQEKSLWKSSHYVLIASIFENTDMNSDECQTCSFTPVVKVQLKGELTYIPTANEHV
ncbi:unnamed protein product [Diatraea saccharalis]|uniref:Uncharacterized protein n=1 Tax=Diatraea saccharalis TaxID=40085 RepID=A0A9N9R5Y6_9NEOP|nr:unnamed protein product [Diatraea saccharalis]